ncbi:AraC family transcriptional regulator [Lachnospiraceae bacterium 45-W7]
MGIFIDLKDDCSEKIPYDRADYPFYIRHSFLSFYPNYVAPPHWHDDIELIIVYQGEMSYNINGKIVPLHTGEGLFVNARQMHFGFSDTHTECEFMYILFHPLLLCITPDMEQKYVLPVIQNEEIPFIHLKPQITWQNEIISKTNLIYSIHKASAATLKIQSILSWIWAIVYENMPKTSHVTHLQNNELSILKNMISFIQQHYNEPVTLQQIALAGSVGQSKCCRLFGEYIHQTPNTYLTAYRLNKGTELLVNTDMNITEIAYAVGFNGASYFAESFRKYFHLSPSEYRNSMCVS